VILWSVEAALAGSAGSGLLHRLTLHKVMVKAVAFSAHDSFLATLGGQDDNNLVVWNVASGDAICGSPASSDSSLCVKWLRSPAEDCLLTAGNLSITQGVWLGTTLVGVSSASIVARNSEVGVTQTVPATSSSLHTTAPPVQAPSSTASSISAYFMRLRPPRGPGYPASPGGRQALPRIREEWEAYVAAVGRAVNYGNPGLWARGGGER